MLYELIFGRNPYNLGDEDFDVDDFKEAIQDDELEFPDREMYEIEYSDELKDFITQLLNKDPSKRPSFDQMKAHPWFIDINWDKVISREEPASLKPTIKFNLTE